MGNVMKRCLRGMVCVALALNTMGFATAQTLRDNFDFVTYLVGSGMKDEAVTLVSSLHGDDDSTAFLKGYTFYNARLLDSAVLFYDRVSPASELYDEAVFFSSLSDAHQGRYGRAAERLSRLRPEDSATANLARFELAGMSLLDRRMDDFDHLMRLTDTADYRLAEEASQLWRVRRDIGTHRAKSPFVAGALSALVPGLGKVYAGQWGEGISAFLITGSLMGVTVENWVRCGVTNWKTICAGLLTAVFYAGNIYGSVVTVKVGMEDFDNQQNVQILYNIHIPLRSSFRR